MRILVLGGTGWLGQTIIRTALAQGHPVAGLARGTTGALPAGAEFIIANRDTNEGEGDGDAYAAVSHQQWDAVIDLARQPGHVRRAAAALARCAQRYIFVSSCSAYADHSVPHEDESAALLPALEGDVMPSMASYGEAKVACERHVLQAFGPARTLIARVGLIGGPGDDSDRSGYWPLRFARPASADGRVLVPDVPTLKTQLIDVRDLAQWLVQCAAQGTAGVFNAVGVSTPWPGFIGLARTVAGHSGATIRVPAEWLTAQGVRPWAGPRSLPLWLPLPDHAGFASRNDHAAVHAGLKRRPLSETLADTLAWELARPTDHPMRAGLTAAEELTLLDTWSTATA